MTERDLAKRLWHSYLCIPVGVTVFLAIWALNLFRKNRPVEVRSRVN